MIICLSLYLKIRVRLQALMAKFPQGGSALNLEGLTESILRGMYPNVTSFEIDTLAAETAASMATQHMLYAKLAAYITVAHNHKITPPTFSDAIQRLTDETGYIEPNLVELVKRRAEEVNAVICHDRDLELTYFGFKTLERSYLLKGNDGKPIERPQYLLMRVALGIHCTNTTAENEDERLQAAFKPMIS